jgi:hypothetical protein
MLINNNYSAPCRLLDVGSMSNPYMGVEGLSALCVDPYPRGSGVEPLHMLQYLDQWRKGREVSGGEKTKKSAGDEARGRGKGKEGVEGGRGGGGGGRHEFDCVALSMVLNCEGDALRR